MAPAVTKKVAVQPLVVTEDVAAQMLTTSQRTMANMAKSGQIPFVKIGASRRYVVKALEDFIAKQLKQ